MTMMTSGPTQAYALAEDVLAAIAGKVYRLGDAHGAGSKVKIINQLLAGVHIAAAAEAVEVAIHAHLAEPAQSDENDLVGAIAVALTLLGLVVLSPALVLVCHATCLAISLCGLPRSIAPAPSARRQRHIVEGVIPFSSGMPV